MAEPVKVKVGDEIAFHSRYHGYTIKKVLKITPSGIIKTDLYDMNPDLSVRGRSDSYTAPYRGEIVTDKIRDAVTRQNIIGLIATTSQDELRELPTESLKTIADLITAGLYYSAKRADNEEES